MIEDYDYDFNMPDVRFHALAIPENSRLQTVRDLNQDHLPMLRNIMAQSVIILLIFVIFNLAKSYIVRLQHHGI